MADNIIKREGLPKGTDDAKHRLVIPEGDSTVGSLELDKHAKQLAKGSFWQTVSIVLMKLVSLLYLLALTHFFSQSSIGDFYFAFSLVGVIGLFTDLGVSNSLVNYVAYYYGRGEFKKLPQLLNTSVTFGLAMNLAAMVLLVLFAQTIASFFSSQAADLIAVLAGYLVVYELFNIMQSFLFSRYAVRASVEGANLQNALKLILTMAFFFLFRDAISQGMILSLGLLVSVAIAAIYMYRSCSKLVSQIPGSAPFKPAIDLQLLKEIMPLSVTLALLTGFWAFLTYTDRLLIQYFMPGAAGSVQIAIYSVSISMALLLTSFASAIGTVFMPMISEEHGKNPNDHGAISKINRMALKWIILTTLPFFVFLLAFAQPILFALYGLEYVSGAPALALFSVGVLFTLLSLPQRNTLAGMLMPYLELKVVALGAAVNIALNYLLIPQYGIVGSAFSSMVSMVLISILINHYAGKIYGFRFAPIFRAFAPVAIVLAIVITAMNFAMSQEALSWLFASRWSAFWALGALFGLACALYGGAILRGRVLDNMDLDTAKAAMRKLGVPDRLAVLLESIILKFEQEIN